MRKFMVRDADDNGEWDNGVVCFVNAPREDLVKDVVAEHHNTKQMNLVVEDVTDDPIYNWKGRG